MPEPSVLHAVERHLAYERRLEVDPFGVLARRPPALAAGHSHAFEALPRLPPEPDAAGLERRQHLSELPSLGRLERRRVPDVVEVPAIVVQAEQQAPDTGPVLGDPVPADHAARGRAVLHLDPAPLS